jgi:hypothetical protein
MKVRKSLLLLSTIALIALGVTLMVPQDASAVAPLGGSWTCNAYAQCSFTRTTSNHATYQWNFGDGSFSGLTTAGTVYHTYNIAQTVTPQHFTVYLMGYATSSGGSPDNIVSCTITTYKPGVGGDPTTYSGTCS